MFGETEKLEGSIQRISAGALIPDGDEHASKIREAVYTVLQRHIEGRWMSLAGDMPFQKVQKCDSCDAYPDGSHIHFRAFLDVDVEVLKKDLDKHREYILSPFKLDDD